MEDRNLARKKFEEKGLKYSAITSKEIATITKLLESELSLFENDGFIMRLNPTKAKHLKFKEDGSLNNVSFRVRGIIKKEKTGLKKDMIHFEDREAITFNPQDSKGVCFVGFAGWADDTNVTPFVSAFSKFVDAFA